MNDSIVVVGSCMIDFVSYAPRLPKKGETIHGTKFVTNFGGKGANQCVAAAKLGGKTTLIARVGDDVWGERYIANLRDQKVETKYVKQTPNFSSGIAQITVSETGDNQIVIVAGANKELSIGDVEMAKSDIASAGVVVMQLETAPEVAIRAMELAKGICILNGAPGLRQYDPRLLKLPTIFCVNETEASEFTGLPVTTKQEAEAAAHHLISKGCNSVVLTLVLTQQAPAMLLSVPWLISWQITANFRWKVSSKVLVSSLRIVSLDRGHKSVFRGRKF